MFVKSVILGVALFFSGCSLSHFARDDLKSFGSASCGPRAEHPVTIYVSNLGWHTGIVIPSEKAQSELGVVIPELKNYPWIEVGWGDKGFYMSSGYSYWSGLAALFFSSGSVIHIVGLPPDPVAYFSDVQLCELQLDEPQFRSLLSYIRDAVILTEKKQPIRLGDALYGQGSFYEANGSFSVFKTCNTWAAGALNSAGCKVDAGVVRASSLFKELCVGPRA